MTQSVSAETVLKCLTATIRSHRNTLEKTDSSLFLLLLLERNLLQHVTQANSDCVKIKMIPCSEQGKLVQMAGSQFTTAAAHLFSSPLTLITKVI